MPDINTPVHAQHIPDKHRQNPSNYYDNYSVIMLLISIDPLLQGWGIPTTLASRAFADVLPMGIKRAVPLADTVKQVTSCLLDDSNIMAVGKTHNN